ncbi:MAG: hypothetical protein Q4P65_01135 [Eubacteriales bacterium]|nr:hypothetical protein [Eubacteriales bacterium]
MKKYSRKSNYPRQNLAGLKIQSNEVQVLIHLQGELSRQYRREVFKLLRLENRKLFYLPLLPTYRLPLNLPRSQGENLTDLILAAESGASFGLNELAKVFAASDEHCFAPRLCGQVDDLLLLSDQVLRRLVENFIQLVKHYPGRTFGLIDCDGLAFRQLALVASLADSLSFDPNLENKGNYASLSALENFLTKLPPKQEIFCLRPELRP